jgi:hypothetical protein
VFSRRGWIIGVGVVNTVNGTFHIRAGFLTVAMEYRCVVVSDGNYVGGESDGAAFVAQLADAEQRVRTKVWKSIISCCWQ